MTATHRRCAFRSQDLLAATFPLVSANDYPNLISLALSMSKQVTYLPLMWPLPIDLL